jgi:hypothetical protein
MKIRKEKKNTRFFASFCKFLFGLQSVIEKINNLPLMQQQK